MLHFPVKSILVFQKRLERNCLGNANKGVCLAGVTNGLCEHSRACEHRDFFANTPGRDKKFALRAASSLESTTRE